MMTLSDSATRTMTKVSLLLRLVLTNSTEARDRISNMIEVRRDRLRGPGSYEVTDLKRLSLVTERALGSRLEPFMAEAACQEIERHVMSEFQRMDHLPYRADHRSDLLLARTCYALCRILNPNVVVETGVAYGVSSAFILQALAVNGRGRLASVDLPPLAVDGDNYVGLLVPADLRLRWILRRGQTSRVLPELLAELGSIDMFVHDSLHTYATMRREFALALEKLRRPGVLVSDDVQDNSAFAEVLEQAPLNWAVVSEADKKSMFGVVVLN
jgi:predicted O-methyltransferase YrrM